MNRLNAQYLPVKSFHSQTLHKPVITNLPPRLVIMPTARSMNTTLMFLRPSMIRNSPDGFNLIRCNLLHLRWPDNMNRLHRLELILEERHPVLRRRPRVLDISLRDHTTIWVVEEKRRVWQHDAVEAVPLIGVCETTVLRLLALDNRSCF